jgi:hypothetical protein
MLPESTTKKTKQTILNKDIPKLLETSTRFAKAIHEEVCYRTGPFSSALNLYAYFLLRKEHLHQLAGVRRPTTHCDVKCATIRLR